MAESTDSLSLLYQLKAGKITPEQVKAKLAGRSRRVSSPPQFAERDIAIISMAGRFPAAASVEAFWQNILAGSDCIREVPPERWSLDRYYSLDPYDGNKHYCRWGGFIDDVDKFDPLFFNISPREAQLMDPAERQLLEVSWTLFERIGLTRARLASQYQGEVGVYVGSMYQQYHAFRTETAKEALVAMSSPASLANRISHFFNLYGPSLLLDTMCSSSGSALHMACESLHKGECRLALVGGVNLTIHPYKYIALCASQLLSTNPESRCFGDTEGFLPAEAVATVLLKPARQALADGDPIEGVIKSSKINHKGYTEGFSIPRSESIVALTQRSLEQAGLKAGQIGYIESSMTGAKLANQAELEALQQVFASSDPQSQPVIGCVKSNIGHAEAAAGITGLIKATLQLKHRQLPATVKPGKGASQQLAQARFRLQTQTEPWPAVQGEPHRILLNNFGASGVNSQIILEACNVDYGAPEGAQPSGGNAMAEEILVFSAQGKQQLRQIALNIQAFVAQQPSVPLAQLARTLQQGREAMPCRAAFVCQSHQLQQAMARLVSRLNDEEQPPGAPEIFFNADASVPKAQTLDTKTATAAQLARYWVQGGIVDWQTLAPSQRGPMLQLPTYPFAKKRCWLDTLAQDDPGPAASAPQTGAAPADDHAAISAVAAEELGKLLNLSADEISHDRPLTTMGMNSINKLAFITALIQRFDFLSQTQDSMDLLRSETLAELCDAIRNRMPPAPSCRATVEEPPAQPEPEHCFLMELSGERYTPPAFMQQHNFGGYQHQLRQQRTENAPLKLGKNSVLVIGAGPGGLVAAITLKHQGVKDVAIVEKRTTIDRMQMVTLYHHTLPFLKHLGILEAVTARANAIEKHDFYRNEAGHEFKYHSAMMKNYDPARLDAAASYSGENVLSQFVGDPVFAISLADLQCVLMEIALEKGVQIRTQSQVELVEDKQQPGHYQARWLAKGHNPKLLKPQFIVIADGRISQSAASIGINYPPCQAPRGEETWYIYHCSTDLPHSRLCYSFEFAAEKLSHCAFGLYYPRRHEFGVAFYASKSFAPEEPDFIKKARFFADSQQASFEGIKWQSKKITVFFSKADAMTKGNAILVGDAAGTASPIAGLGSVLAISAYGWATEQFWQDWQTSPELARRNYQKNAGSYVDLWAKRSTDIWQEIDNLVAHPLRKP